LTKIRTNPHRRKHQTLTRSEIAVRPTMIGDKKNYISTGTTDGTKRVKPQTNNTFWKENKNE